MLLRDLYDLYGRLWDEGLLSVPERFRRARVAVVVDLDRHGNVQTVSQPEDQMGRPLERVVPDAPRAAQVQATLVVDKLGYVLGLPPDMDNAKQVRRAADQHAAYLALLDECGAAMPQDVASRLAAVRTATSDRDALARELVRHGVPLELAGVIDPAGSLSDLQRKKIKDQAQWLVDFTVDGLRFFPSVVRHGADNYAEGCVAWWGEQMAVHSTSDRHGVCQVTSSYGPLARLLPAIGELPGNSPRLVSCNFDAASRYGAAQADGASVSPQAGSRATQALKWLAGEGRDLHRWNLDDLVLVWWCPDDLDYNHLNVLTEPNPDPTQVQRLLGSMWSGREKARATSAFHLAGLTVNSARVVVRMEHTATLSQLKQRLEHWFSTLRPVHDAAPQVSLGLYALAAGACPPGRNQAAARSRVAIDLARHVLVGGRLPLALRNQVVRRCAVGTVNRQGRRVHVTPAQAALLHAVARSHEEDPMSDSQARLCGRAFAVLEYTQQQALGYDLNRGIQDSYGSAAATPHLVFPRLLRLRSAHLKKLRRKNKGKARFVDRKLEEVMAELATADAFPRYLTPTEQAEFALGYFHERHSLYTPKDNAAANTDTDGATEHPDQEKQEDSEATL